MVDHLGENLCTFGWVFHFQVEYLQPDQVQPSVPEVPVGHDPLAFPMGLRPVVPHPVGAVPQVQPRYGWENHRCLFAYLQARLDCIFQEISNHVGDPNSTLEGMPHHPLHPDNELDVHAGQFPIIVRVGLISSLSV